MNLSFKSIHTTLLLVTLLVTQQANALDLIVGDKDSVCAATSKIIDGMLDYYDGSEYGGVVGMFKVPYYWWQAGEAFGGMIGNWYYCQDTKHEELIYASLMAQRGEDYNYIPSNQSLTEGNDDQAFWGLAVLEAMERNFTNPPSDQPGWLALSQAVYNTMWARWDPEHCGGGLRWQIFTWNKGYDYKNVISNSCLFHIAARLGRYTNNNTYVETAETVYDWLVNTSGFIKLEDETYIVYDGAGIANNCSQLSAERWTYNLGIMMAGCAYLYNHTEDQKWATEVDRYVNGMSIFLNSSNNNILYEQQCQEAGKCSNDQRSFKSIFSRCMAATAKLVPKHTDYFMKIIDASAEGAAKSCSGGSDGVTCGINWSYGGWDGWYGLGEQMTALEIIQSTLLMDREAAYSNETGGSSEGNAEAGLDTKDYSNKNEFEVSQKDKTGAAILTTVVLVIFLMLAVWMLI
ncbi:unnamed protein product [Ambrosiozyma monospora]|uniref:Unnamed protein product n=1 Tax=Ambrosiozyma monospora TaxID=43982 RepID=A0ACB5SUB0_AMBMO|nr:unnamed protein product [Ambrosiozyma monospora]